MGDDASLLTRRLRGVVQGGEGVTAANGLGSSSHARAVAAVQLRVTRRPLISAHLPSTATATATATPTPAPTAESGHVSSAHAAAAESSTLCARVRGGRFCRRAVLVLAPPRGGAARHRIELHATMLDTDGLAFGGEVDVWFEVQTRP